MAKKRSQTANPENKGPIGLIESVPLWHLDIAEVTGHNLEARGREEVNRLLQSGWRLLLIYTLKYEEDGVWRERPMAILGKPRDARHDEGAESERLSF
jgi:hypothetical protein